MHALQPLPPERGDAPAPLPPPPWTVATQRADRRWHRALRVGMVLAVVVHLVALLWFRTTRIPPRPFAAAGPDQGDYRAAAGGGDGLQAVAVRVETTQPEAVTPTPTPVPVPVPEPVEPVRPDPQPVEVAERVAATPTQPGTGQSGQGGGEGAAVGPGTETGTGRGGGGADEEGASGLVAPTPRGMILPPPDRPRSARGREVTVWVFVNERGRVVADSTRLEPPTPDARYNQRLKRSAAEWVFEPARRAGRAVGAWYPYEIIL